MAKKKGKKQERPTCVFCRKRPPLVKMSDEHIFKESLKHLATGTGVRMNFVYPDPETGELRHDIWEDRNKNAYQLTVKVCRDCNTDVLNNLIEEPIAEKLQEMIEGRSVSLDSDAVLQLARWAAKTAMTRELLDKRMGAPPIPPDQYAFLYDHLLPPPNMMVFFGKCDYAPDTFHRHRRFSMVDLEGKIPTGHGHFTTLVLGHLWIIVAGFSTREMMKELYIDVEWHCRSLAQIWPPKKHEIDEAANVLVLDPKEFPPGPQASKDVVLFLSSGPSRIGWTPEEGG